MEPISLGVGLIPLMKLTFSIVTYIQDVKDAPRQYHELIIEVANLDQLLRSLDSLLTKNALPTQDSDALDQLRNPEGLLKQLKGDLEWLEDKLASARSKRSLTRSVTWSFDRSRLEVIRHSIERAKSSILIILVEHTADQNASMKEGVKSVLSNQEQEQRTRMLKWLSPLDYTSRQQKNLSERHPGTSEWFLDLRKYQEWRSGTANATLFCTGMPGAGKTIISSLIVADLLSQCNNSPHAAVACLFCKFDEADEQKAPALLSAIIRQILEQNPSQSLSLELMQSFHMSGSPTYASLVRAFESLLASFQHVYVLIDALDENEEGSRVQKDLVPLLKTLDVKLMVTSRPIAAIERQFTDAVYLNITAKDHDIHAYVNWRVEDTESIARHLRTGTILDDELREEIANVVTSKTQGMFLLAKFHVDALEHKRTRGRLREALRSLPPSLPESYDQMWERIKCQPPDLADLAKSILSWMSNAMQPLMIDELQDALAVKSDTTDKDIDDLPDKEMMLSVCAGLLSIEKRGIGNAESLRLVHYTAQEWLIDRRTTLFSQQTSYFAATCLQYLSYDFDCSNVLVISPFTGADFRDPGPTLNAAYPFHWYAANYLGEHMQGENELLFLDRLVRLLKSPRHLRCIIWSLDQNGSAYHHVEAQKPLGNLMKDESITHGFSGLNVAGFWGLSHVISAIFEEMVQQEIACYGYLALMEALAMHRKAATMTLLQREEIDHMISHTDKTPYGYTPLILAARAGWDDVMQILLDKGADIHRAGCFGSPLHLASENHNVRTATFLLNHGAKVNEAVTIRLAEKQKCLWTPIFIAMSNEARDLGVLDSFMDLMLKNGADVCVTDNKGRNVLHIVAWYDNPAGINWVLNHSNIDVSARTIEGATALHCCAKCRDGRSRTKSLELLLGAGALVDELTPEGDTALQLAIKSFQETTIIEVLCQHGANACCTYANGVTVFHSHSPRPYSYDLQNRHAQNLRCCIKFGLDANCTTKDGRSLIWAAVETSNLHSITILHEEFQVDLHTPNLEGCTLLQLACQRYSLKVIEYLVDHGVDTQVRDGDGHTIRDLTYLSYETLVDQDLKKLPWGEQAEIAQFTDGQLSILHFLDSIGISYEEKLRRSYLP